MPNKKLILVGGGQHCKSCIDVIEISALYEIEGILDFNIGEKILNYSVIGHDNEIPRLISQGFEFLITVGHIKTNQIRVKLFDILKQNNAKIASIVSPTAYFSKYAKIGKGSIIMHQAFVNADAEIGENSIINTKATIEHDVKIGNHTHISVNVTMGGDVKIGNNCFIGSAAIIYNGVSICDNVLIGAGSVVHKSITQSGVYVGYPLKKIK